MKAHLKFNTRRPLLFIFIICCCLTILFSSHSLLPPQNSSDSLQMLLLNPNTEPIFYITSQINYTPNTLYSWLSTSPEPSLLADAKSDVMSKVALTSSTKSTNSSEPSLATSDTLNLILKLSDVLPDEQQITKDLSALTPYFSDISLSVLPSETMSDKDYLAYYKKLYDVLQNHQLTSVHLIAYPATNSKLSLYDQSYISCIGTVLSNQSDLEKLDKIYNYFSSQKTLVVRDEIKAFYKDDIQTAAKEITACYYLLAVKYPMIQEIFAPCITPQIPTEDDYILVGSDPNYYLFYTIYNRLLEKPWITTSTNAVGNISPYQPVEDYDLLTGTVELILDPDSSVFEYIEETPAENYSIFMSLNDTFLNINTSYPYSVSVDTNNEPNGVSRLSAIIQEKDQQLPTAYSVDFMVKHPVELTRPERVTTSTVINSSYVKPSKTYIPVLMYHTIEDTVLPEDQNSHVETAVFEAQMKGLLDNGYTPINFYDLKNYAKGLVSLPEKPILITMDDGYLNNYTNAYPIYKKYNIQATLFVSPYYMKEENTERHFGWIAAKEMEDSGLIDIQPHGYNHTPLPYLSLKDAKYHASHAQGLIEMHLGTRDVNVLAYPQFRHNWRTINLLNELNFDFQITNLAKVGTVLTSGPSFNPPELQRINVPNTMTPEELVSTLDEFTAS